MNARIRRILPRSNLKTGWRRRIIFPLLLAGSFQFAAAQKFGANPPAVRWMQINTDSLRVIFPKGGKQQALQVLNTSLYVNQHERASIGNKLQKLNIILQPNTVISNGFVALAPFRSIFQTTPPSENFSLGINDWLSQLSIHETWHALQNMNFKAGLGNTFHTLFGGTGQAFITHLLIPDWYWEGDAVFMETYLTGEGRGRLPAFMAPFKSFWQSDIDYSYAKLRNGSFKDIVPTAYPLGYMMVGYGRDRYGFNFWRPVLQETLLNQKFIKNNNRRHPDTPFHLLNYSLYPLSAALKYNTGKNVKHFYKAANAYFKDKWQHDLQSAVLSSADTIKTPTSATVVNYKYPTLTKEGKLFVVKYGFAKNPAIVRIDQNGHESTVTPMGNALDYYYSYGGEKIVWAEYRPDIRWGWKSYSVIRLYDCTQNTTRTLTRKSRYFSPALSSDGQRIIAVEVRPESRSRLTILDAEDGHKIKTLPNPNHYLYTYPVFGNSDHAVIVGAKDSLGNMALIQINLRDGGQTVLTPFAPKAIGAPVNTKENIYFPAAYNHNIQLYAFRKADKAVFRIATRPIGNYSMAVDTLHRKIIFDEYTANGFQLLSMDIDTSQWRPITYEKITETNNPFIPRALSYGPAGTILKEVADKNYPARRYYPLKHLFSVHSWSFLSLYPETSLFLQSRDLMGTLQAAAGAGYNLNEETIFADAHFLYGGIFPYIKAGARKTFDRQRFLSNNALVRWDEMNWYAGFEIPLNLSGSLYQKQLSLSGTFHQSVLNYKASRQIEKQSKSITYYTARLSFQQLRYRTIQDINPKFGLAFSFVYDHTLGTAGASQLTSNLNLFFPGLLPNHSLYFTSAYSEKQNASRYKFNDNFSYAIGYSSIPYKNIYMLGINYQLPLFYPDVGLTWIFLQRIRLHTFYNYSHAQLLPGPEETYGTYRSAGLSVYFDTRIFNALTVPIGLRYSRLLDTDPENPGSAYRFSISFPINLFESN